MQAQGPMPGETIAGRYEIIDRIGAGGFGAVYRARQLDLNREVAIKTLLPHLASVDGVEERFRREAELASDLTSPHTIRLYDFGKSGSGMLYMVMELLDGRELAKAMRAEGTFSPELTRKVSLEILDSLAEAHAHGVVHRDLKPSNVFLAKRRRDENFVKVLDFGIAKAVSQDNSPEAQQLTATGQALGTPFYMSPEQIRGRNIGGHSDIYSLGLIMIQMLTGRIAVQGETPLETVLLHVSDQPVAMPPWLADSHLGHIIARATAKNFQARYANADDMIADLESVDLSGLMHAAAAAGGADAWQPPAPVSGPFDSAQISAMHSGPMQARSGQMQARSGQIQGHPGMHTPHPQTANYPVSGLHTPMPGNMHTPHSGMNPALLQSQEMAQQQSGGGRGKIAVLVAMILAVVVLGGIVAMTMLNSQGDAGQPDANASTPPDGETTAAVDPADPIDSDLEIPEPTDPNLAALAGEDETPQTGAATDTPDEGATETAAVETVSVTVNSEPAGADVVRGDEILGQTPLTFETPRAEGTLDLTIALDEYETASLAIDAEAGGVHDVELVKVAAATTGADDDDERRAERREQRRREREKREREKREKETEKQDTQTGSTSGGSDSSGRGGGSLAVPD